MHVGFELSTLCVKKVGSVDIIRPYLYRHHIIYSYTAHLAV